MRPFTKKLSLLVLTFAVVLSGVVPARAQAQFGGIVHDPISYVVNSATSIATGAISVTSNSISVKEYLLDPLIWSIKTMAVQSIVRSTVNWINTGFQGSPAFVTDLNERFRTVGDTVAADFLNQLEVSGSIDSPFRDLIAQGLRDQYYRSTGAGGFFSQNQYTLGSYSEDPQAFLAGDFAKGGFSAWFAAQQPQNNPFTSYLAASNELNRRVSTAQEYEKTQLDWGNGFRSYKENCTGTQAEASGVNAQAAADASVSLDSTDPCLSSSIVTPGSIIKSQLDKVLGSGMDQYLSADEFDEIINSLAGQLINKVLGTGGGLRSLSQPSTGGGSSYLDQATAPVQQTGGGTNAASVFGQSITEQRSQVQQFQQNWQKIQGVATTAQSCSTDASVQTTLTTAGQKLAKAANALSALDKIAADLSAAQSATGAAQTAKMQQVFDEYQTLFSSGTLPTGEEIIQADEQSQDVSGSLYNQMKTACSSGA